MKRTQDLPDILVDIIRETNVDVIVSPSIDALVGEIGRQSLFGGGGKTLFGTAFVQGNRLQFATAISIDDMLEISQIDRAKKGATLSELEVHSNRPAETNHANKLSSYLKDTACSGQKFILPAMTFNFGVAVIEDDPGTQATLALLGGAPASATAWPAILTLPPAVLLDTTDGAHRRTAIEAVLAAKDKSASEKTVLRLNAVPITIVFESSASDSHQDFADCGTAKPIAKSVVTGYDVRDALNSATGKLVKDCQFLHHYVDGTAGTVNLSKGSLKVWSLSAIRTFVGYICDRHPFVMEHPKDGRAETAAKLRGVNAYFKQLVLNIPTLQVLDAHRDGRTQDGAAPALRDRFGGDVSMRAAGMLMLAIGYLHCERHGVPYADMAKFLGKIDWLLLDCERDQVTSSDDETFASALERHTKPHWRPLLTVRGNKYRISASPSSAAEAWDLIIKGTPLEIPAEAAALQNAA